MFRHASPELYQASRFALYAERLMPLLDQMKEIRNTPAPHGDPKAFFALTRAKLDAAKAIPLFEAVLFPKDDDGVA